MNVSYVPFSDPMTDTIRKAATDEVGVLTLYGNVEPSGFNEGLFFNIFAMVNFSILQVLCIINNLILLECMR
jgi:hypothetical protein